jgi:hypothetical protein
MIERLNPSSLSPQAGIPGKDSSLFASRSSLRKLRVLVDAELLDLLEMTTISSDLILAGLLTHPLISLYRYADDGPSGDLSPREYGTWTKAYEGWATVEPPEPEMGIRNVTYADDITVTRTGIIGNIIEIARQDARTSVYSELGPEVAALKREADAVGAQVASSIGADIFITNRPFLHESNTVYARDVTVLNLSSALPVVSLYLRAQGQFIPFRDLDGGMFTMNRGLFYWVGTRELLPSAWRWFGACVTESHAVGNDTLTYLGQSALQRVQRALVARDTVHCMLNQPQNNDVADDILSNLDVILVLLMGAIDATARVAHISLNFSQSKSKLRKAGWQNSDWLKLVRNEAPSLADIVVDGSPGNHLLTILRSLRNSVHGEALQPLAVQQTGRRIETLFGLPRSDMDELVAACEALGGASRWGIKEQIPGRMHADPHALLEELFPRVVDLLDSLMTHTPVEGLANVDAATLPSGPPDEGSMGTFDEKNRNSIRWQLGL